MGETRAFGSRARDRSRAAERGRFVLLCQLALVGALVVVATPDAAGTSPPGLAPCSDADTCFALGAEHDKATPRDLGGAMAYYAQACGLGHLKACYNVGVGHLQGKGLPLDPVAAEAAFKTSCNGGYARACFNLGALADKATGPEADLQAMTWYAKACGLGDAQSCYNVGIGYETGTGLPKDATAASRSFATACQLGYSKGCLKAAPAVRQDDASSRAAAGIPDYSDY